MEDRLDKDISSEENNGKTELSFQTGGDIALTKAMHTGLGIESPFMKEIYLTRQSIVGIRYPGGAEKLVEELHPGSRITFLREPDNPYDEKAVMALDEEGRKLGYIPRHENAVVSALLDAGKYFYGIITEVPEGPYYTDTKIPYSLWVDLYMREFRLPGEIYEIPKQGSRGSYAVVALDFDEEDESENSLRSIYAIKVINGEERGIFQRCIARKETADPGTTDKTEESPDRPQTGSTDEIEGSHSMFLDFRKYVGYLPLVSYGLTGKKLEMLENAYAVHLGKVLPNQVIDTEFMARIHLPNEPEYSLEHLTHRCSLRINCDNEIEKRCRETWKLYRWLDGDKAQKNNKLLQNERRNRK